LAFTTTVGSTRLWSLPLDDSHLRIAGAGEPVTPAGVGVLMSDLANDGRRLAYISNAPDGDQVWVADLVTGAPPKMVASGQQGSRISVHWSRDGARLAYMWWHPRDASREVWESSIAFQETDGNPQLLRTPTVVARNAKFALPTDWSPKGDFVLASSDLFTPAFSIGLWPVAKAPRAESGVTTLSSDREYNLWQGSYSPNGKWIAFVAQKLREAGVVRIAVMPSSGGDSTHWTFVTDAKFMTDKPRWSRDGKLLYYLQLERDFLNMWAQRVDLDTGVPAGGPIRVTHLNTPGRQIPAVMGRIEPSVSATRLILPIVEVTGGIWILDLGNR
jgi:Tol biopolymer transport system component